MTQREIDLTQQLQAAREEIAQLRNTNQQYRDLHARQDAMLEQSLHNNARLLELVHGLEQEVESLRQDHAVQMTSAICRYSSAEAERDSLQEHVAQLRENQMPLAKKVHELEATNASLTNELKLVKNVISTLVQELVPLMPMMDRVRVAEMLIKKYYFITSHQEGPAEL